MDTNAEDREGQPYIAHNIMQQVDSFICLGILLFSHTIPLRRKVYGIQKYIT